MTNKGNLEKGLGIVKNHLNSLNNSYSEDLEGEVETADGMFPIEGIVVDHGNHTYLILASDAWEWVNVEYPLNIDQLYALRRLDDVDPSGERTISNSKIQQARSELGQRLGDIPYQERRKFRMNLIQMISGDGCALKLDTTGPAKIHGVNIRKKLFVFEDEFSLSNFAYHTQDLVTKGWVAKEYLVENYGFIPPDEEDEFESDRGENFL